MIKIKVKLEATVYVSDMLTWSHDMSSGCQLTNQNDHASTPLKTSPSTSESTLIIVCLLLFVPGTQISCKLKPRPFHRSAGFDDV